MRLSGSCKANSPRDVSIILVWAPTNCSTDAIQGTSCQNSMTSYAQQSGWHRDVSRESEWQARSAILEPGSLFLSFEKEKSLVALDSNHRLFPASTNSSGPSHWHSTWHSSSPSWCWIQIDQIAFIYRWLGCLQDFRSFWAILFDSDHMLTRTKLSLCFSVQSKRARQHRLNWTKPP